MFEWENYLVLSEHLFITNEENTSLSEAKLRTSISRAYYYVFNLSKDFCEINCIPTPPIKFVGGGINNSKHARIIFGLCKYGEKQNTLKKEFRDASSLMNSLRIKRVHADYNKTPIENITEETNTAISLAKELSTSFSYLNKRLPKV
jgi:uncharacterized protein (UPF0332 family)